MCIRDSLWFALGTIPTSIALALLMAVWVNDRITGRTLVRMAFFTPTILPMICLLYTSQAQADREWFL